MHAHQPRRALRLPPPAAAGGRCAVDATPRAYPPPRQQLSVGLPCGSTFLSFINSHPLQELDVEGEMQRGLLPGLMSLSAKFVPTLKSVSALTVSERAVA